MIARSATLVIAELGAMNVRISGAIALGSVERAFERARMRRIYSTPMPRLAQDVGRRLANLSRPHYVLRPAQAMRRVASDLRRQPDESWLRLPWGASITCSPRESVGRGILRRGIYDLLVCETLLRLTDVGETALDVGANIGQMTSLLAHAVGPAGRVIAVEPHPIVFGRLARNASHWTGAATQPWVELHDFGLSNVDGTAVLSTDVFEINQGSPTLESDPRRRSAKDAHDVEVHRLDTVLGPDAVIGVMKLDVEGHELHVLEGASDALSFGRVRDIVFEEREQPPTPVTEFLREHGYVVMRLGERLWGPVLGPIDAAAITPRYGDDRSLVATRSPDRAAARLHPRGWAIYGIGPAGRVDRRHRQRASH